MNAQDANPASRTVAVSACLLGVRCRYDGRSKPCDSLMRELESGGAHIVPLCPEQLGGLPTPRAAAVFVGGSGPEVLAGTARLVNLDGADVTESYIRGARETLRLCKRLGVRKVYLKEKSPACGVQFVTVEDELVPGMGVAAAGLAQAGIELISVGLTAG